MNILKRIVVSGYTLGLLLVVLSGISHKFVPVGFATLIIPLVFAVALGLIHSSIKREKIARLECAKVIGIYFISLAGGLVLAFPGMVQELSLRGAVLLGIFGFVFYGVLLYIALRLGSRLAKSPENAKV
ncbi:MAG: hypothetical protein QOE22_450 [Candidatus Parcubacteria bacterium]|jgi:hypothetical protein|nr:hypothetical protein [Candidatus Parcubacteria bacterium]